MKSANELKYLAEKFGWKVGPLTFGKIQHMNSDEASFHDIFNKTEYERALNEPQTKAAAKKEAAKAAEETEQVKAENTKNLNAWAGKKFWESELPPEELEKAKKEAEVFHSRYPQFVLNNQQNADALRDWLFANRLSLTAANLAKAFNALTKEGRLILNPAVCGIIRIQMGDGQVLDIKSESLPDYQRRNPPSIEGRGVFRKTVQKPIKILPAVEAVTGSELVNHPLFKTLTEAYDSVAETKRYNDSLSADEYRRQHGEAFREPLASVKVAEQIKREINSFLSFHPEYVLSEENKKHLCAYIEKRHLPFTLNSLETAYTDLVREGYIKPNPEAVVSSNGTKLVDYGGGPGRAKLPYEINRMSAKEYEEWIQNPANRRAVDALAVA